MVRWQDFNLFLAMVVIGVVLEVIISQFHYIYTKKDFKKYHFSLARYFFLMLFPLIAVLVSTFQVGTTLIRAFLIFALVGTLLEWFVGFSYHMVLGQRLWTYYRYNIGTYTSLLSIPLWGLAGVVFWLLAKVV